jgi:branched-chain amino acid transport system permease protein
VVERGGTQEGAGRLIVSGEDFAIQLLTGLSRAGLLFIVSVGLTLVFGALRVINFAHGSLYMVGAFVTASVVALVGGEVGLLPALLLAGVAAAAVGVIFEVAVLRRLYGKEHLLQLLATYALVLVVADLVRLVWGAQNRTVERPAGLDGSIDVLGGPFPVYSLFIIGAAAAIGIAMWWLMSRTGLGRDIRAAVVDPEMLGGVGVDVRKLFTMVFALGAMLAGLGGAIVAPSGAVGPGMDIDIMVEAFAVTIIGGLGSIPGAIAASFLVAAVESIGGYFWDLSSATIVMFGLVIVLLSIRPQGLFGHVQG